MEMLRAIHPDSCYQQSHAEKAASGAKACIMFRPFFAARSSESYWLG
jgi:hypothetical protein